MSQAHKQMFWNEQPVPSAYLRPSDRLDFDSPLVAATIGGRPVILGSAKYRFDSSGEQVMVPMTESRFQHAIDIENQRFVEPWRPSLLSGFDPLQVDSWLSPGGLACAATLAAGAVAGWLLAPKR
jgi:hypothetical protein